MTVETPQPRYQQIAAQIRAAIERGDYEPGAALDSENTLAARYQVDKRTVNSAMRILRAEGLVRVERGRGAIVRELPILTRDAATRFRIRAEAGARGAYEAELARAGLESVVDQPDVAPAAVPDDIGQVLGLEPGAQALTRARRMYARKPGNPETYPVQLATSWIPADLAEGTPIEQMDTGPGGTYSRLADLGHAPAEFTETITLRLPDDAERDFLKMDAEQRVYLIRRVAREAAGRAVEVTDTVMPAHQWRLAYTWAAETS
jgi:GntR family transcriptional regulator